MISSPCSHCGHVEESTKWNDPGKLAPVGTWMYVKVPQGTGIEYDEPDMLRIADKDYSAIAFRTRHLTEREGLMEYRLLDGGRITDKLWWTHA